MAAKIKPTDQALDRLMKSVPTEFATGFLALNSFVQSAAPEVQAKILQPAVLLMLVLLPVFQQKARNISSIRQLVAACLAFGVLTINVNGSALLGWTDFYNPYIGGAAVILWAVIAPILTAPRRHAEDEGDARQHGENDGDPTI
jgi:hypothetical protein